MIFAAAPMMGYTDRHFRYMLRLLNKDVVLYTEMVTAEAINHKDSIGQRRLLAYDATENPNLVLQLGGNDPQKLAFAAQVAADLGYQALNLNIGCPSNRVKQGNFGACLMLQPLLVAECVAHIQAASALPVSVKLRIGVDHHDDYEFLTNFITIVKGAGCKEFIVHARKAWLNGLSPKQNRSIPVLDYSRVYRLKKDFPDCAIIINGGIIDMCSALQHMQYVDGVMIGRALYNNPLLAVVLAREGNTFNMRDNCIKPMLDYVERQAASGIALTKMLRHLNGLFFARSHAKTWRCLLTETAVAGSVYLAQNTQRLLQFCADHN